MEERQTVMTADDFKMTWDLILTVCRTAQLVSIEDVETLLETANRAHSIMPILDPTAYRNGMGNLKEQAIIGKAFLGLLQAIDKVKQLNEDDTL